MPVEYCTVDRVLESATVKPDVTRFDVNVTSLRGTLGTSYETIDPWVASLCARVAETKEPIALTWCDSKYGKQIIEARTLKANERAFHRQLAADRVMP